MQNEQPQKDSYELHLDEMSLKLKECQNTKGLRSCLNCDLVLECIVRTNYVDAVYSSMAKGNSGGFDF